MIGIDAALGIGFLLGVALTVPLTIYATLYHTNVQGLKERIETVRVESFGKGKDAALSEMSLERLVFQPETRFVFQKRYVVIMERFRFGVFVTPYWETRLLIHQKLDTDGIEKFAKALDTIAGLTSLKNLGISIITRVLSEAAALKEKTNVPSKLKNGNDLGQVQG